MKKDCKNFIKQEKNIFSVFNLTILKNILFSLSFISILSPFYAHSADLFEIPLPTTQGGEWEISSNSLVSLDNGAIVEASGDVIVQNKENILRADFARYYTATGWIFIQGNVLVKLGRDELSANEAEINLHNLTGFLRDGIVLMESNHIYVSGEYVEKHYGDKYSFINASITSCDPQSPLWQVNAGSAIIELDGSATITSANMSIADKIKTPSIPYSTFPLDKKRESGFLMPRPKYDSLLGLSLTLPAFWAISQERDITFAVTNFQNAGTLTSAVYRSYTEINDKTWLGFDYLFSDATIGSDRIFTKDKYWFRGMLNGEIMSSDWLYKLNIDYVSDPDFLDVFSDSYAGYDKTIDESYDFFGRDFAQITKDRVSEGYIYRTWDDLLFVAGFRYSQNPIYGDSLPLSENTTVQVPAQVKGYVMPINLLPFLQADAMGGFSYNYRHSGISGAKSILQPRISAPLSLGVISLLPQLSLVQRNYFASTKDTTDAPLESPTRNLTTANSTMLNFSTSSMLQASRVWNLDNEAPLLAITENIGKSQNIAVQHLIEPLISYNLVPRVDQENLPYYDSEDRLVAQSELSFSIRNAVVAKKETIIPVVNDSNNSIDEEENATVRTSFEPVLNLTLTASYNFEEERRTKYVDNYPRRPFRDFEINSQFYPFGMNWSAYATISPYGDGITRFDLSTNIPLFSLERFVTWSTALSYRNTMYDYQNIVQYATSDTIRLSKKVTLLKNNLVLRPFESLKLSLGLYRDLNEKSSYEASTRVDYYHDCFEFGVKYTYSPEKQSAGIIISIPGILQ